MQIKRNQKKKNNNNLIWQRNVLRIKVTHYFTILVLSAIIIVSPSLSSQSQTNDSISKYSSGRNVNGIDNNSSSQIAIPSQLEKPYYFLF
jgi:hypothetical protein